MNLTTFLRHTAIPLLDFIYPPSCLICRRPPEDHSQKVCASCWQSIQQLSLHHPLYLETRQKLLCDHYIQDLVSCYLFEKEGAFQHIAHALKYQEFKSLGIELGKQIGHTMQRRNIDADVIIPVPLHKRKYRERGYNQAEYLAKGIALVFDKPILSSVLQRKRYTQTQTKLSAEERCNNMQGAFVILDTNIINGKICLLVDDVITTGATINACAKELIHGGASKIIAASSALAQ
ncbi:MAG TPA: ComF family protein [Bacteroidota bacterium]|nr:ComF family protein [Bacteroidota bacterium]